MRRWRPMAAQRAHGGIERARPRVLVHEHGRDASRLMRPANRFDVLLGESIAQSYSSASSSPTSARRAPGARQPRPTVQVLAQQEQIPDTDELADERAIPLRRPSRPRSWPWRPGTDDQVSRPARDVQVAAFHDAPLASLYPSDSAEPDPKASRLLALSSSNQVILPLPVQDRPEQRLVQSTTIHPVWTMTGAVIRTPSADGSTGHITGDPMMRRCAIEVGRRDGARDTRCARRSSRSATTSGSTTEAASAPSR